MRGQPKIGSMEIVAVNALLCPHCGRSFIYPLPGANALVCADGHSFDIARQGYVNLLTGHGTKFISDTADMVAARDAFLDAGHYSALANEVARQVSKQLSRAQLSKAQLSAGESEPAVIVDAGTGTGWYLHQVLASVNTETEEQFGEMPNVAAVGLDISKFALRRAARRNPQVANIVWDLWRELPLGTDTADVVLVIFAPRNVREFARILKPGGTVIVITPLPGHLAEIAQDAGMLAIQNDKEVALVQAMAEHFVLVDSQELRVPLLLDPPDVVNVALMGPAGHHLDADELRKRLSNLSVQTQGHAEKNAQPQTSATAAFRISTFAQVP